MKIEINFQNKTENKIPKRKILLALKNFICEKLFLSQSEIELGIHIVSENEIKKLNKKFRHLDRPTDVLSFPQYKNIKRINDAFERLIDLGDIFICPKEAETNAKKIGKSFDEEMIFLALHGLKHLIGIHHR